VAAFVCPAGRGPAVPGGDRHRRHRASRTGHLLHKHGFDVGLDGLHERRGTGPTTVVTGTGVYRFLAHQPGRPGDPVAYDPCRTLQVVVNDALAHPRERGRCPG
jgi:hypothetical protein